MKLKKTVLNIFLALFSIFLPFFKIKKNRISFVSLENDTLEGDFKLISEKLEAEGKYDIYYELVKFEKTLLGNFSYFIECIRQLFVINTSELVLLDFNNYVVSNFKRKKVKVLQIWHSSGAIKKFGNLVERDYEIKNYDYAIVNTPEFIDVFAKGFSVRPENVIVTGIPKTDALFEREELEKKAEAFFNEHPGIKEKKKILYAPTFRGRLMTAFRDYYLDLEKMHEELGDEYVIMYRLHPLVQKEIAQEGEGIVCCNTDDLYTLMQASDILVSDYSALIIDYSVFHKPMYFFVPDLEEYSRMPGVSFDYEKTMPGHVVKTQEELVQAIKEEKTTEEDIIAFQKKFFPYTDGKSTERVVQLIDSIMNKENIT